MSENNDSSIPLLSKLTTSYTPFFTFLDNVNSQVSTQASSSESKKNYLTRMNKCCKNSLNILFDENCVLNIYKNRIYKITSLDICINANFSTTSYKWEASFVSKSDLVSLLNILSSFEIDTEYNETCCNPCLANVKENHIVINLKNSTENTLFVRAIYGFVIMQVIRDSATLTLPQDGDLAAIELYSYLYDSSLDNVFSITVNVSLCKVDKAVYIYDSYNTDTCEAKKSNCDHCNQCSDSDSDTNSLDSNDKCKKENNSDSQIIEGLGSDQNSDRTQIAKNEKNRKHKQVYCDLIVNNLFVKNVASLLEGNLIVVKGDVKTTNLNVDKANIQDLNIENLETNKLSASKFCANEAGTVKFFADETKLEKVYVETICSKDVNSNNVNIEKINAKNAEIENINSSTINGNLVSVDVKAKNIKTDKLKVSKIIKEKSEYTDRR
jgi:hypothetical protein